MVVRAQKAEVAKQAGTAAAAAALASVISLTTVDAAYADVAGLTKCSESKAFEKTRKNEVKKLEKRKKLVRGSHGTITLTVACPIRQSSAGIHVDASEGVAQAWLRDGRFLPSAPEPPIDVHHYCFVAGRNQAVPSINISCHDALVLFPIQFTVPQCILGVHVHVRLYGVPDWPYSQFQQGYLHAISEFGGAQH